MIDYDADADNLIRVSTTAQLSAIRYDLRGRGLSGVGAADREAYRAAFELLDENTTCPGTCIGYELSNDIDLSGVDWRPIGGGVANSRLGSGAAYMGVFEGNGYVIRNMAIVSEQRRLDNVGLFGVLGVAGRIRNVGLSGASVRVRNDGERAGTLAGENRGRIAASYALASRVQTGGIAGGLVGVNNGTVIACYADVMVNITNPLGGSPGGLLGSLGGLGVVRASYSMGMPTRAIGSVLGGLVGNRSGEIRDSYFDRDRSGLSSCCGGGVALTPDVTPKRSDELRVPTAAEGIYAGWDRLNVDDTTGTVMGAMTLNDDSPWDFGTFYQYPVLVFGGDAGVRAARRTSQQEVQPAVVLTPTLEGSETVPEGGAATYVVRLPGALPPGVGASWNWSLNVGAGAAGAADFAGTTRGRVVIAPGQSGASFALMTAVDGVAELAEAFEVTMSNARLDGALGDVTIGVPDGVARTTIAANELRVSASVYLQGAYDAGRGVLKTNLADVLPRSQPYGVSPWHYPATTTVPLVDSELGLGEVFPEVVDWVLVELRTTTSGAAAAAAAAAVPTTGNLAAGLLLRDGRIAGVNEGATTTTMALSRAGVRFAAPRLPAGEDVYVLIHHRNHLSVMSAQPAAFGGAGCEGRYCVDFRGRQSYRGCAQLRSGEAYVMVAGDVNRSGAVSWGDDDFILNNLGAPSYRSQGTNYIVDADLNFDGRVSVGDAQAILDNNLLTTEECTLRP